MGERTEDIIRQRLTQALTPEYLEIIDESAQHVGHPGARSGKGHYRVKICAPCLTKQSRITAHRMINQAVQDLFDTHIHALAIEILPQKKGPADS